MHARAPHVNPSVTGVESRPLETLTLVRAHSFPQPGELNRNAMECLCNIMQPHIVEPDLESEMGETKWFMNRTWHEPNRTKAILCGIPWEGTQ